MHLLGRSYCSWTAVGATISRMTTDEAEDKRKAKAIERNKMIARTYYECGERGDMSEFFELADDDFTVTAPAYLPWGGMHRGKERFRQILTQAGAHVDFGRFAIDSLTAEDNRVVALVRAGVVGGPSMLRMSEHWEFKNGLASSLWVAYFEPEALLSHIRASALS